MIFYNSTKPYNVKATYAEYDNLNFAINYGEELSLISGSVRLNFDLTMLDENDAVISPGKNTFIDAMTGGHAVVSSVSTALRTGQLENLQNYNKYVSMKNNASLTKNSTFASDKVAELIGHDNNLQRFALRYPSSSGTAAASMVSTVPVSLKLECVLNHMTDTEEDTPALLSGKNGEISVQIQLERALALFCGPTAGFTYTIANPSLTYQTTSAAPSKSVLMRVKQSLKQNVNSNNFNLSSNAPYIVEGVSGTFIMTDEEYQHDFNHFQCHALKGI